MKIVQTTNNMVGTEREVEENVRYEECVFVIIDFKNSCNLFDRKLVNYLYCKELSPNLACDIKQIWGELINFCFP